MIGESLGPYKIIELLGAGGMAEVYLGEDTRLGRKVAIKVLPPEFASDPERLARFEQEARAAAALNHPHIAAVFDVGTEGDTHFIVQEYLEGQSLRERLDKEGALPLDKALDLAIEVGEALIAAHKAGIIHRDLKPDNIFVTEESHAKVLDFGIAKAMGADEGDAETAAATNLTMARTLIGTAPYMSPEQVRGQPVDATSDIWSLGCLFYELLTARAAFTKETMADTLSAVLVGEPDWGALPGDCPDWGATEATHLRGCRRYPSGVVARPEQDSLRKVAPRTLCSADARWSRRKIDRPPRSRRPEP